MTDILNSLPPTPKKTGMYALPRETAGLIFIIQSVLYIDGVIWYEYSSSSLKILYLPDVDEGKKSSSQEMMANDAVLSTDVAAMVYSSAL